MLDALKESLTGILKSKKAMMALISILVWVAGRYGVDLSPEELAPVVGPIWLAIFGQGVADIGKGKAEAQARLGGAPMERLK